MDKEKNEVWEVKIDDSSDHDALKLFYKSKLSRQPFSGLSYLQRIETVRYYNRIKKNVRSRERERIWKKKMRTEKKMGN